MESRQRAVQAACGMREETKRRQALQQAQQTQKYVADQQAVNARLGSKYLEERQFDKVRIHFTLLDLVFYIPICAIIPIIELLIHLLSI